MPAAGVAQSIGSESRVLVVGAGPVGLTMACELFRQGIPCRIVDAGGGAIPLNESRALVVWERTLEVFRDLGVADAAVQRGKWVQGVSFFSGTGTGVEKIMRLDTGLGDDDTRFSHPLSLPQWETERLLEERLAQLGGKVERNTRLVALEQDGEGVTASVVHAGYTPEEIRTCWVIGCDGAGSTVRKLLAVDFEGEKYQEKFHLADVRLEGESSPVEARVLLRPGGGALAAFPLPQNGYWRLIDATGGPEVRGAEDITLRFRPLLEEWTPPQRIVEVFWSSSFSIHRRIASQFRVGRCFLAGDAAHIHSPLGGQGMNTGIQDAWNLGWKLGLAAQGRGGEELLDSYDAERRPVAAAVLRVTDLATRVVMMHSRVGGEVRNSAMRFLGGRGMFRSSLRRASSELDVGYRSSPVVAGASPMLGGGTPVPGDRLPDASLGEGKRLFDLLGGTVHHLLLFTGVNPWPEDAAALKRVAAAVEERYAGLIAVRFVQHPDAPVFSGDLIVDEEGGLHRRFGADAPSVLLVRPDRHIGYFRDLVDPGEFAEYLAYLFGDR